MTVFLYLCKHRNVNHNHIDNALLSIEQEVHEGGDKKIVYFEYCARNLKYIKSQSKNGNIISFDNAFLYWLIKK